MRKHIHALALCGLITACGTTTTGPNPFVAAAAGIAGLASEWAVNQYPDKRPQFKAAAEALTVWLDTGKISGNRLDVATLNSILSNLNLGQEGWGANGELYLQAGLIVWNLAAGVNYQITSQPAIQYVGSSIRDGFLRGLSKVQAAEEPGVTVTRELTLRAPAPPLRPRIGPIQKI